MRGLALLVSSAEALNMRPSHQSLANYLEVLDMKEALTTDAKKSKSLISTSSESESGINNLHLECRLELDETWSMFSSSPCTEGFERKLDSLLEKIRENADYEHSCSFLRYENRKSDTSLRSLLKKAHEKCGFVTLRKEIMDKNGLIVHALETEIEIAKEIEILAKGAQEMLEEPEPEENVGNGGSGSAPGVAGEGADGDAAAAGKAAQKSGSANGKSGSQQKPPSVEQIHKKHLLEAAKHVGSGEWVSELTSKENPPSEERRDEILKEQQDIAGFVDLKTVLAKNSEIPVLTDSDIETLSEFTLGQELPFTHGGKKGGKKGDNDDGREFIYGGVALSHKWNEIAFEKNQEKYILKKKAAQEAQKDAEAKAAADAAPRAGSLPPAAHGASAAGSTQAATAGSTQAAAPVLLDAEEKKDKKDDYTSFFQKKKSANPRHLHSKKPRQHLSAEAVQAPFVSTKVEKKEDKKVEKVEKTDESVEAESEDGSNMQSEAEESEESTDSEEMKAEEEGAKSENANKNASAETVNSETDESDAETADAETVSADAETVSADAERAEKAVEKKETVAVAMDAKKVDVDTKKMEETIENELEQEAAEKKEDAKKKVASVGKKKDDKKEEKKDDKKEEKKDDSDKKEEKKDDSDKKEEKKDDSDKKEEKKDDYKKSDDKKEKKESDKKDADQKKDYDNKEKDGEEPTEEEKKDDDKKKDEDNKEKDGEEPTEEEKEAGLGDDPVKKQMPWDDANTHEEASPKAFVWPASEVLYCVDPEISAPAQHVMLEAINKIEKSKVGDCLAFRAVNYEIKEDKDSGKKIKQCSGAENVASIAIQSSEAGCFGNLGVVRQPNNVINLGKGCEWTGIALKLLVQSLGLPYEHQRPDRDEFLTVDDSVQSNPILEKLQEQSTVYPYDYASITHTSPFPHNYYVAKKKPDDAHKKDEDSKDSDKKEESKDEGDKKEDKNKESLLEQNPTPEPAANPEPASDNPNTKAATVITKDEGKQELIGQAIGLSDGDELKIATLYCPGGMLPSSWNLSGKYGLYVWATIGGTGLVLCLLGSMQYLGK